MILMYLLMLMWPPPHLLKNAVGVWGTRVPLMMPCSPLRQRLARRVPNDDGTPPHRLWPGQHHVPVVAS
jgi:hypothetical protein